MAGNKNREKKVGENMKKLIRKEILAARQSLDSEKVATKSKIICEKIAALKSFREANTVMGYLPFRNETDPTLLFPLLWEQGKKVVIPVCDPTRVALIPSLLNNPEEDLQPGTWGILEPKPSCLRPVPLEKIDFVIIPGVAFDCAGNRLGYGGGYYDRFLPLLRSDTRKVAVAFQLQVVGTLVPDRFDRPVDMVVTEEKIYTPSGSEQEGTRV